MPTQTPETPQTAINTPTSHANKKDGPSIEQAPDGLTEALQTALNERAYEQANFFQADISVARDPNLTPLQKTVYMILCTYRNNTTGEAWPSKETIANYAQCQPNAVRTAYRALENAGYIQTKKREINGRQTTNLITFPTLNPRASIQPQPARKEPTSAYHTKKETTTNNNTKKSNQKDTNLAQWAHYKNYINQKAAQKHDKQAQTWTQLTPKTRKIYHEHHKTIKTQPEYLAIKTFNNLQQDLQPPTNHHTYNNPTPPNTHTQTNTPQPKPPTPQQKQTLKQQLNQLKTQLTHPPQPTPTPTK